MEEWDLRLLEHTAIRMETKVDYKVWQELLLNKAMEESRFPGINDLIKISKDADDYLLSARSRELIDDAIRNSDAVRRAAEKYAKIAEEHNIRMIARDYVYYPRIWEGISGMPPVLFVKGDIKTLFYLDYYGGASIVGSRVPGRYSLYATGDFVSKLCAKNIVIVSGMALGIDRKAHEVCLDNGGRTLAVVPGGCDVIYPYQNRDIYDRICETGAVVSEMPPGQEVIKQYFPSRNRLISALSDVCLIMEAGEHSGTLHTASFAAAQGRDVFVLPNSIYADNSIGGLKMLQDGAEVLIDSDTVYGRIQDKVIFREDDLWFGEDDYVYPEKFDISVLRDMMRDCPEDLNEDDWKELICDEISEKPKNIDELCVCMGMPFSYLSALVTGLETEGRIANERGKYVLTIQGR